MMDNYVGSTESRKRNAFRPVIAARVSDEVVDQLSHAIHTGIYEVGDRLPRTNELAATMRVSIPTVSEAVGLLTRAHVLQVKRGPAGGIVVASSIIPPEILMAPRPVARDMRELVEARRPIELALSRLAAQRATDSDFREMRAAIELQKRSMGDLASWSFGNFKFHYAIGRAARSELLFHFQTEVTKELAKLLDGWTPRDRETPAATLAEHQEILASLESRNLERVEEAVHRHLLELEQVAEARAEE